MRKSKNKGLQGLYYPWCHCHFFAFWWQLESFIMRPLNWCKKLWSLGMKTQNKKYRKVNNQPYMIVQFLPTEGFKFLKMTFKIFKMKDDWPSVLSCLSLYSLINPQPAISLIFGYVKMIAFHGNYKAKSYQILPNLFVILF